MQLGVCARCAARAVCSEAREEGDEGAAACTPSGACDSTIAAACCCTAAPAALGPTRCCLLLSTAGHPLPTLLAPTTSEGEHAAAPPPWHHRRRGRPCAPALLPFCLPTHHQWPPTWCAPQLQRALLLLLLLHRCAEFERVGGQGGIGPEGEADHAGASKHLRVCDSAEGVVCVGGWSGRHHAMMGGHGCVCGWVGVGGCGYGVCLKLVLCAQQPAKASLLQASITASHAQLHQAGSSSSQRARHLKRPPHLHLLP